MKNKDYTMLVLINDGLKLMVEETDDELQKVQIIEALEMNEIELKKYDITKEVA